VVGTIPVLGEPADALNAAIYCLEGDWTSAGLSAAAMVPFWGWGATSIKWGIRVADVARGLKTAGKYTDLDPFEKLVAQYISERGDALLGIGDDAVKKVLGLPRGNNKPKAADFLSITPSGKFNITEVKGSFAGYVDVSTARKQLTLVVGKLKSIVPGAKIGTIELAIPKNAKLDPPYEVFGNQLLLVTEEGKEVIRIDGHPVIVVEVP
jgi:hypothetical protein